MSRFALRLALSRLVRRPLRAGVLILILSLGMAARIATDAISGTIRGAFAGLVSATAGRASLVVTRGELGLEPELVEQLTARPEFEHVAGLWETVTRRTDRPGPILVLGLDLLGDRALYPVVATSSSAAAIFDDPIPFLNDPHAVLVPSRFAARLGARVGSWVEVLGTRGPVAVRIAGLVDAPLIDGAFDGAVLFMYSAAAEQLFAARLTRIDLQPTEAMTQEAARTAAEAVVGGAGRVERPQDRARHLARVLGPIGLGLDLAGLLALLVGGLLVFSAVTVEVSERRRELGLFRALGATRREVRGFFVTEIGVHAVLAGAVAVPVGRALAGFGLEQAVPAVSRFFMAIRPPPPQLTPPSVALALLLGLVTAALAAWLGARGATAVEPSSGLRAAPSVVDGVGRHAGRLAAAGVSTSVVAFLFVRLSTPGAGTIALPALALGAALAVPWVVSAAAEALRPAFQAILGLPGRLGVDAAARRGERTALTVGALWVAVSASVALSTWSASLEASAQSWLDHALPADLYVTQGSLLADQHNVPLSPERWPTLAQLPGVAEAYPVRTVSVDVGPSRVLFVAFDTLSYERASALRGTGLEVLDGTLPPGTLAARPCVAMAENAARKLDLHAGGELWVETRRGRTALPIAAIIRDYASEEGTVAIDRRWFLELFGDERVDSVDLVLSPGASLDEVRERVLDALGGGDSTYVISQAQVRQEIGEVLRQFLAVFRSVELVALQVALLGVASALFAAVLDRRRQLAVLRAIGATRAQVAGSVAAEALFVGVVASAGGVLLGVPLGDALVRTVAEGATGWQLAVTVPTGAALRVASLGVGTALLAAVLPAGWAARQPIVPGLGREG